MSDAIAVLSWWLIIQVFGLAVWPLAARWLRWLPDRGYMLAKPIGLLFVSYGLWILATLGIIENTAGGIMAVLVLVAASSIVAYRRLQSPRPQSGQSSFQLLGWLRDHRALVIAYEVLFAIALIGWALFRAHNPDLTSTEKPMEFAFFNAIGRSPHFPPPDPWLSGYAIAYYYFGYVMMSLLHQLSGVTAGTAFSLTNAFWFALSAASAFGVVANIVLLSSAKKHPERSETKSKDERSETKSKDEQSDTKSKDEQSDTKSKDERSSTATSTPLTLRSVSAQNAYTKGQRAAIVFGTLAAIMLVLMGNFEAYLETLRVSGSGSPQFWTQLDILNLNQPFAPENPAGWPPRFWWWWRASRVIHDYPPSAVSPQLARVTGLPPAPNDTYEEVIDEFPQFSFLLGDNHPHVLALPFALLMMALALNLYQGSASGEIASLWLGAQRAPVWPLYALSVGSLGFLNTWDFPIYAFVLAAALTLGRWRAGRFNAGESLSDLIVLGVGGFALYIPFYRGFTSQAAGIAPNLFNGTRAVQFFVMFGPFIVIGVMFGIAVLIEAVRAKQIRWLPFVGKSLGGGIALVAAMALLMGGLGFLVTRISKQAQKLIDDATAAMAPAGIMPADHLLARLADPWVMLSLGVALAAIFLLWRARRSQSSNLPSTNYQLPNYHLSDFVLLLYAVGALLTFGVEFAFIIDTFGTRMNTVFKFYYQAWALWSVASAFAVYYLVWESSHLKLWLRSAIGAVVVGMVGLGLLYPMLAIPDKINEVMTPDIEPTLDAMQVTGEFVPDEYAVAQWLNQNIPDTPFILEAPGDEYNAATSRFSAWTGLPAFVGWPVHEWQWRGSYDIQGPRADITTEIYSTSDGQRAVSLLKSNDIRYVIVGPNERSHYPASGLTKFDQLFPIVVRQGNVTVYEVP
jgi:YYY domain-containing protein